MSGFDDLSTMDGVLIRNRYWVITSGPTVTSFLSTQFSRCTHQTRYYCFSLIASHAHLKPVRCGIATGRRCFKNRFTIAAGYCITTMEIHLSDIWFQGDVPSFL